jgi:thioesterase domain-containing protein/acyl carrier protein
LPPLKILMLGGESLSSDVAVRLLASGRVGRLLNCYGPTECTVCVTVADVTTPVPEVIPIGRSVPGTEVLVLNENGDRLPDGKIGEICVFGKQVTLGYVNDPVETNERFAIGPAGTAGSQRYYRTGDLGYRTDTGVVYFAGRADRQVKVNGIRIELGEIETALRSHSQISEATAIVRDDGRTVAYAVPIKDDVDIDIADLRKYLTQSLPRFMVPAGIMVLAELPITVNGKLDTSALPEWSPGRHETGPLGAENLDEFTARVIEVAANVTEFAGQIRPSDDFIDNLGGTSLGIVRLLTELERYSGRRIRINDALADTSIVGLARLFREETVHAPADFAFNIDGDSPPLFLIHAYLGGMLAFRRLAELLPNNQPVYGLHVYSNADQPYSELTMSALAESALTRIREIQPAGQVAIVGHSAGGLIAFEAARMILGSGDLEPLVMLMDAPRPYNAFGYLWGEFILHWRQMIRGAVRTPRKAAAGLLHVARPEQAVPELTAEPGDLMALAERHSRAIESAIKSWKAQTYKGSITLMRTRQGRAMAFGRPYLGWASVTQGALKIIVVPGGHLNMLDAPYLHNVAEELTKWLSET